MAALLEASCFSLSAITHALALPVLLSLFSKKLVLLFALMFFSSCFGSFCPLGIISGCLPSRQKADFGLLQNECLIFSHMGRISAVTSCDAASDCCVRLNSYQVIATGDAIVGQCNRYGLFRRKRA